MKNLEDKDVISIMRQEWQKKINTLSEQVDLILKTKVDGKEVNPISSDFKVKHKETGIIYTVQSASTKDVVLRTPEGDDFTVSAQNFKDNYASD